MQERPTFAEGLYLLDTKTKPLGVSFVDSQ